MRKAAFFRILEHLAFNLCGFAISKMPCQQMKSWS